MSDEFKRAVTDFKKKSEWKDELLYPNEKQKRVIRKLVALSEEEGLTDQEWLGVLGFVAHFVAFDDKLPVRQQIMNIAVIQAVLSAILFAKALTTFDPKNAMGITNMEGLVRIANPEGNFRDFFQKYMM